MSPQPLSGYLSVLLVVLGRVDPSRSAWVLVGAGFILSPIRQTSAHTSARDCQALATASVATCAASGRMAAWPVGNFPDTGTWQNILGLVNGSPRPPGRRATTTLDRYDIVSIGSQHVKEESTWAGVDDRRIGFGRSRTY